MTAEGMYDKYRVIKVSDLHDVDMREKVNSIAIDDFVFVLRPDRDYHARVALAAYTESVSAYNKELAEDLRGVLELMDPPTRMEPD